MQFDSLREPEQKPVENDAARWRGLVRSLRLHQWVKNGLVFVPLVLGGVMDEPLKVAAAAVAFIALGFVASATYLINDTIDAEDDRKHWSKKHRPIASGVLPVSWAMASAAIGLGVGFALAAAVSWSAVAVLAVYLGLTLAYSFGIKRLPLFDGFVLAVLFTLRLGLGVAASGVPPSPWLFVFSMFLFISLSFAKRYTELVRTDRPGSATLAGRGYRVDDAPLVLAFGLATAIGSVIIMVLYIIEDAFRQSFYGSTQFLWGFPALIFLLICRIWLVTFRGEMHDDPVRFVIRDRHSLMLLALFVVCFYLAWM
jgi:4-hydroxybenzoate polyprenyltransferase